MNIHDLAASLERNLREQIAAEERLLAVLDDQRASMRRLSADGLRAACGRLEAEAGAMAALGAEGRRLLALVGGLLPGGAALTFDALLGLLPAELRLRLSALRRHAQDLADRIARTNGVNLLVTQRAVAHFAGLLAIITGGSLVTYTRRGQGRRGGGNAIVDRVA